MYHINSGRGNFMNRGRHVDIGRNIGRGEHRGNVSIRGSYTNRGDRGSMNTDSKTFAGCLLQKDPEEYYLNGESVTLECGHKLAVMTAACSD